MGDAVAARNYAARLYARLARDFQAQVEALIDDGFSVARPIPQIVAPVLERSNGSLASLITEIRRLRDEFADRLPVEQLQAGPVGGGREEEGEHVAEAFAFGGDGVVVRAGATNWLALAMGLARVRRA